MATIEEITIKVPSGIAEAYRRATKEEQEQIQLKFASIMQLNFCNSRKEAIQKLRNTMDEVSKESQAKGLTPEILESILQDDE
ncbi:hypothetical protein VB711_21170 [Cronbergia sp. UHCC 0137]|uniref:hypothetical protein n=1 Tax=Cronbergia sp. UHCC 0137 TaxID=3110239 RepID=UPI002B21D8C1|nr:hypothetical protein [Cronbergia sp. UHCC 0137]MEA5620336.1 hypothetical protein [Cronbergia sp. UHCC 0137]